MRVPFNTLVALLALLVVTETARAGDGPSPAADEAQVLREVAVANRVMHAFDLIGTPYQRRGNDPETGFDCSGFIHWLFREANGISLPRSARQLFGMESPRAMPVERDVLEAGDLVFFHIGRLGRQVDHVGMYVGEGRFIHAPASGGEVRVDNLALPYYRKHWAGARRILDVAVPGRLAPEDQDQEN